LFFESGDTTIESGVFGPDKSIFPYTLGQLRSAANLGGSTMRLFANFLVISVLLTALAPAAGLLFDTPTLYHSRPNSLSIAFGDFNDDGILDIAQGMSYSDCVMFHIGNGDGTFQSLYPYYIFLYGEADFMQVGDLNGDGLDDLACLTSNFTSVLRIFYSDSTSDAVPNLSDTPQMYVFTSDQVHYLELVDIDNDGWLDILIGNDGQVMYNNGDGTFADRTYFGYSYNDHINADFNHDGYPDFVIYSAYGMLVTMSDGIGGYSEPDTVSLVDSYGGYLCLADMTGDGELDLVYSGTNVGYTTFWVEIAVNQGDGVFADGVSHDILPAGYRFFTIGDVFNDGYNDVVTTKQTDYSDFSYAVINNAGGLSFGTASFYPADHRPGPSFCHDLNGDGYDDIINGGWTALGVFLNHGDGSFPETGDYFALEDNYNTLMIKEMTSADFNGDNYPDIAVFGQYGVGVTFTGHYLHLYYNDGTGQITSTGDNLISLLWVEYWKDSEADYLIQGDFIGDGATDMVVCGHDNYRIFTGPLQAGGTAYGENFALAGEATGIAADVDRDNDLDLVLSSTADILVRKNTGGVLSAGTTFDNVATEISISIDTLDLDHVATSIWSRFPDTTTAIRSKMTAAATLPPCRQYPYYPGQIRGARSTLSPPILTATVMEMRRFFSIPHRMLPPGS